MNIQNENLRPLKIKILPLQNFGSLRLKQKIARNVMFTAFPQFSQQILSSKLLLIDKKVSMVYKLKPITIHHLGFVVKNVVDLTFLKNFSNKQIGLNAQIKC